MTLLDNVTVRVTIEVSKKNPHHWNEHDTIAKTCIEDVSSCSFEEIEGKIDTVSADAKARAQVQLANTKRIKALEKQNALLAEGKTE